MQGEPRGVNLHSIIGRVDPPQFIYGAWLCDSDRQVIVSGQAGAGKSFFIMDMCIAMASGTEFCGSPYYGGGPKRCMVLDLEMGEGMILHRIKSLAKGRNLNLFVDFPYDNIEVFCPGAGLPRGFSYSEPKHKQWLMREVDIFEPDVIVVDPLVRWAGGTDENDNKGMDRVLASMLTLLPETKWIIAHHTGKGGLYDQSGQRRSISERSRGASAIEGAVDRLIGITARRDGVKVVECGKTRNSPPFPDFGFKISDRDTDPQWARIEQVKIPVRGSRKKSTAGRSPGGSTS